MGSSSSRMFFVKSTTYGNETTATDSITAKPISWRIPIDEGYWTLDGPNIDYWEEEEGYEERDEEYEAGEYAIFDEFDHDIFGEIKLNSFLYKFDPIGAEDTGKGRDTKVFARPHGRDVLKYYFGGNCPECGHITWACQGCGGFKYRFPDLRGGRGNNLSCPACMGFDLAPPCRVRKRMCC